MLLAGVLKYHITKNTANKMNKQTRNIFLSLSFVMATYLLVKDKIIFQEYGFN